MRINKDKYNCCGCTLCSFICPKNAIKMFPDALGFLYPKVDDALCVDCGLCVNFCSFRSEYKIEDALPELLVYGGRHKNDDEIVKSQSGAAFVALSDYILLKGGVVYGAGYKDHFRVVHKRADNVKDRDEFRGSKYVQSDISGIFGQIKEDLDNNHLVMFSGTPCQTSAVGSYLSKHRYRNNLFLMDLVCHGTSGPFLWRDYLEFLERKQGLKITHLKFRDKRYNGWHSNKESFTFANSQTYTYAYTFYSQLNLRYSCSNCPFTNLRRPSDITVGDFWGVEKTKASQLGEDNKGCSLFIINTKKGVDWFNQISDSLLYVRVGLGDITQPQLLHPTKFNKKRDLLEKDYIKYGFPYVRRKYGNVGVNIVINKIKSILSRIFEFFNDEIRNTYIS